MTNNNKFINNFTNKFTNEFTIKFINKFTNDSQFNSWQYNVKDIHS